MKTKQFITNAIIPTLLFVGICTNEALASDKKVVTTTTTVVTTVKDTAAGTVAYNKKPKFAERGKPRASDVYWYRMAQCETRQNWKDGGRYAGGLGIMTFGRFNDRSKGTWERWGGEDFALSPDKATIEEQILVANRISTQGYVAYKKRDPVRAKKNGLPVVYLYHKYPVGFNGWGCMKHIGEPVLFTKPAYFLVYDRFHLKQRGQRVKDLQKFMGITADGYYGPFTKRVHKKFKKQYGALLIAEKNKYSF